MRGSTRASRASPDSRRPIKSPTSHTSSSSSTRNGEENYRTRCHLAEVERDRLNEYVGVLSQRVADSQEAKAQAEASLRHERRKNARLERIVEKNQVEALSTSSSSSIFRMAATVAGNEGDESSSTDADVKATLRQEVQALQAELEECQKAREEDRDMYLRMAAETRKMVEHRT